MNGQPFAFLAAALVAGAAAAQGPPSPPPAPPGTASAALNVSIRIDASIRHQALEGFGASFYENFDLQTGADLMGELRERVNEAVFGQVGLTMGHLDVSPHESFVPEPRATANDDDDPFHFNWEGFNFVRSRLQYEGIVVPGRAFGFDNFSINTGMNVRWSDPWMADIRRRDYALYLEEMAENAIAPLVHWRARYGIVPRWFHLFNEPTTGNAQLSGGGVQEVVDLVKTVGSRLRREGFADMRLAVASEETEEASLATARAILADPEARRYAGAITFHAYPYGSIYSRVDRILATSGEGRPDAGRIAVRRAIRDLAREHGLQVWMTEVSHGGGTPLESARARAIHIHDEMKYADASSYWAMTQAWDTFAPRAANDDDSVVLFNSVRGTVRINGIGYAIGHYARWLKRGAIRVHSEADDPMVLAIAFRDDSRRRLVVVVINNHRDSAVATITTAGSPDLAGRIEGEQSSAAGYWLPLDETAVPPDGPALVRLPGRSITTLALAFR